MTDTERIFQDIQNAFKLVDEYLYHIREELIYDLHNALLEETGASSYVEIDTPEEYDPGGIHETTSAEEVPDIASQVEDEAVPFETHDELEPESKSEWITTALKIRFPDVRVHEPSEDEAERIFAKVGGQEHLVEYLDYMRELADTGYAITSPLGFLRHLTKNYDLAQLQNQRDDLREEGMDHSALVRAAMKQADRKIRSQPAAAMADTSRGKRFSQMREKVGANT